MKLSTSSTSIAVTYLLQILQEVHEELQSSDQYILLSWPDCPPHSSWELPKAY